MDSKQIVNDALVSAIIPTYNRRKYIVAAMDSVFNQTYRPIELIVIDDGSTDNTAKVIDNWQKRLCHDPYFTFKYVIQNNQGAPVARNHGLKIARGEYIQFLDSDDKLNEAKIAIQMKWFSENSNMDLVISSSAYFSDSGIKPFKPNILPSGQVTKDQSMAWFFEHDVFIHDPLHKKDSILEIAGFDEDLKYGQETYLHLKLGIKGVNAFIFSDILAHVRLHMGDRITQNLKKTDSKFVRTYYSSFFSMDLSLQKKEELKSLIFKRLLKSSKNRLLQRKIIDSYKFLNIAIESKQKRNKFLSTIYLIQLFLYNFSQIIFELPSIIKNKR